MLDRYTIYSSSEEIAERFGISVEESIETQYNAAPTKKLPVVVNVAKEGLSYFYWGTITKWSNKKSISTKLINATEEDLEKKTSLKLGLTSRRCIIPANGFYLWKTVGKKSKRPYYFSLPNRPLFGIAGIWEDYDDLDGKRLHTFRMITTKSVLNNTDFGEVMPAILSHQDEQGWLSSNQDMEATHASISPLSSVSEISYHPVAPLITNTDYNIPEMIKIQPSIDQSGNYTLFE